MPAPWEQYGLYITGLAGTVSMAKNLFRAHHLANYMKLRERPGCEQEALYAADMTNLHPHELRRAGAMLANLRARGAIAVLAYPALWTFWRQLHNTTQR